MSWLFSCIGCGSKKVAEREETKTLDFQHFSLTSVPPYAFECERFLEELYLDCNQISELPKELFLCQELQILSLSDNDLHNIPAAISSLTNLTSLDISKNGIGDIPDNIKGCKRLRIVNASTNPLCRLPEGFTQLVALKELSLSDTFLEYLPANFGRLTGLEVLELRENQLNTLPRSMTRLTSLRRLDLGQNEFTELPEVVGHLVSLTDLWVDSNRVKRIPSEVGNLGQLTFLDLSKNRLAEIDPGIGSCKSLTHLYLTRNDLETLPDSLCQCRKLSTLHVDDNHLERLPDDLGLLDRLVELKASQNELSGLPPSLGLLRNLEFLHLDENLMTSLPVEIGSCVSLIVLTAAHNHLSQMPAEMGSLAGLRVLNLCGNVVQTLPVSFSKLQLTALWLSANQAKPLVPLQCTTDASGQKVLTCYMLPQSLTQGSPTPASRAEDDRPLTEAEMEARRARSLIHFAADGDPKPGGRLSRVPTPYPKELRALAKHTKNILALKKEKEAARSGVSDPVAKEAEISSATTPQGHVSSLITLKSSSSNAASSVKVASNIASGSAIKPPTLPQDGGVAQKEENIPLQKIYSPPKDSGTPTKEAHSSSKEVCSPPKEVSPTPKEVSPTPKEVYSPPGESHSPPEDVCSPEKEIYPSRIGYSPKKEVYSPTKESYSLRKEPYSPQKEVYSPTKESHSPKKEVYSPTKESYSPQKESYSPTKESYSPQRNAYAPKNGYSSPNEGYSLGKLVTTSPSEATVKISSSGGGTAPLCQNGTPPTPSIQGVTRDPTNSQPPMTSPAAPSVPPSAMTSSPIYNASNPPYTSSEGGGSTPYGVYPPPAHRPASIAVADSATSAMAPRGGYPARPGSLALEGSLPPWKNQRPGSLAAPINTVGIPMAAQAKRAVSQNALYKLPQEPSFLGSRSPSSPVQEGVPHPGERRANGDYSGEIAAPGDTLRAASDEVQKLNEKNARCSPGVTGVDDSISPGSTRGLVSIINQVTEDRSLSPGAKEDPEPPKGQTKIPTFAPKILSPQYQSPLGEYHNHSKIPSPPGQSKIASPPGETGAPSKIPHYASTPTKGGPTPVAWKATSPEVTTNIPTFSSRIPPPSVASPGGQHGPPFFSRIPPPTVSPVGSTVESPGAHSALKGTSEKPRTQIPMFGATPPRKDGDSDTHKTPPGVSEPHKITPKGDSLPKLKMPSREYTKGSTPEREIISPKGTSRIPTFGSPVTPGEVKSPQGLMSPETPVSPQQTFVRSPSQTDRESFIPIKRGLQTPQGGLPNPQGKEAALVSPAVERPINQTGIPILAPRDATGADKSTRIPTGSNSSLRGRKSQIPSSAQRDLKYQHGGK